MNFPPQAYIIGAAKAGTTSLAELLSTHPHIAVAEPKEPDYFGGQYHRGLAWYKGCFAHARPGALLVDASTSYAASLWDAPCALVAKRILSARPDARLVMMVRDPVERAWSSYWHAVRAGTEKRSFAQAIESPRSVHVGASLYWQRLVEFRRHWDPSAMLVVSFSDFVRQPHQVAYRVAEFFGVDPQGLPTPSAQQAHRNTSFRWNRAGALLRQAVGRRGIAALNRLARMTLPESLYAALKKTVSSPVPKIPFEEALALSQMFEDDARCLFEDLGVETRTGPWWRGATVSRRDSADSLQLTTASK